MISASGSEAASQAGVLAPGWQTSAARHELKYVGPASRVGAMEALLVAHCPPDPDFAENVVHSVYYDTPRLVAYRDKADGQYVKEKLRLRWYEPGDGHAWLESKFRVGALGGKRRKRIAFAPLERPDEVALAALVREHLSVSLRPVLWLSYRRLRRIAPDGSARIALDRDVSVRWAASTLAQRRPPGRLPFFVVEVKGDHAQPAPWLSRLIGRYARKTALSKYGLCVDHVRGGCA